MVMTLAQLAADLPAVRWTGDTEREIRAVTADSRGAGPGVLFVAVQGASGDGHDFLAQALAAGCPAVIVQADRQPLPPAGPSLPPPAVGVAETTRPLPALLARRLNDRPDSRMTVVGVTGTNGKTTVTFLLQSLLGQLVGPCGLLGTIRYDDGRASRPAPLTTPSGPDLYDWLGRMVANGCRAVAMEISSHALVQQRVAGLELDAAVMTNIGRDHLDYHEDLESYVAAKATIKEHLLRQDKGGVGTLVLNGDDPWLSRIDGGPAPVIPFRAQPVAGSADPRVLQLRAARLGLEGTDLEFAWAGRSLVVQSPLVGRFNVQNLAAALAAGIALGLDPPACAAALGRVAQVPGRLERIPLPGGGLAVIDYAHTPDGLAAVLQTCRELGSGRLLLVFGCGGDRDRGKRPLMGAVAARHADAVWITSDNPRSEDPAAICADILGGWSEGGPQPLSGRPQVVVDRAAAITRALHQTGPGEIVVIAGKGHEDYQLIGGRRLDFSDRAVVDAWVAGQVQHD